MPPSDNATPYLASAYDRDIRPTIPFYDAVHHQTIDLVKTVKPDVACWLDTGCGTGRLAEVALPLFPHTQFVLADPAEAMLLEAHRRFDGVPEQRVKFLHPASSECLPAYKDDLTPQVITAILCHHYLQVQQRVEAIRACYRILDRDGLFITFENVEPRTPRGTQIGLERWRRYQLEQGRTVTTVEAHLQRFKTAYFPITINSHLDLLEAAGFRTVEPFWLSQMQAGFYAIK